MKRRLSNIKPVVKQGPCPKKRKYIANASKDCAMPSMKSTEEDCFDNDRERPDVTEVEGKALTM